MSPEPHAETRAERLMQFLKYCTVGVLNTLITMGVIYICKSFLGWNIYLGNFLGYGAGIANSFVCNRSWVFSSKGNASRQALQFGVGAGVCYLVQLGVVWMITESPFGSLEFLFGHIVISGYGIATIIGNVVYTVAFFIYNRTITFSK